MIEIKQKYAEKALIELKGEGNVHDSVTHAFAKH